MKQKVSDYIAEYIAQWGIRDVFTVTGGGAMHMNDAFGHHKMLHCTYQHHEQACAMAAEAYARLGNKRAAVCVTTGPGATNAITGVLGAWMDSIPMLVFSGQARYATTVSASGLPLRSMGVQECNIVPVVKSLTKYAHMIVHPENIRYHLEKALYLAVNGRPGPVWLDIPLDVQGAVIETDDLKAYDPEENPEQKPREIKDETVEQILDKLQESKRPVLSPGNGVRLAGAHEDFYQLAELLGVPVVTGMSSVDAIESDHPLFVGRSGGTGTRPGNFALQNSDVLLSLGNRQGFAQTGFRYQDWARESYTILNDIDENELKKPSLHVSLPVCGDAGELIRKLIKAAKKRGASKENPLFQGNAWRNQCLLWKQKYPVVVSGHYEIVEDGCTNIYAFYEELSRAMKENQNLMVSVGTSRVAGSQASALYYKSQYGIYGILPSGGNRGVYCIRETAGSLCDRRRKPSDEYSGTADDQAESSSDKTFCNQQSGISFHSTDSAELFWRTSGGSWTGERRPELSGSSEAYSGLWISVQMYSQLRKTVGYD